MSDSKKNKSIWMESPTIDSFVLNQKIVANLDENVVRNLIEATQRHMRNQEIEGILGQLSPEFEMSAPVQSIGKTIIQTLNKTQFLESLYATFETSNTTSYTIKINNIVLNKGQTSVVSATITSPKDRNFQSFFKESLDEVIQIGIYKGRPVVERVVVEYDA